MILDSGKTGAVDGTAGSMFESVVILDSGKTLEVFTDKSPKFESVVILDSGKTEGCRDCLF